ncbi:unnamed protein product [Psylliodes chrysocephalus]|uniref:Uncharacterized protein n=1 Tax=Psylliodes chrysocephalus TaxID=3402493 RepID=A0A9P0D6I1_9CUCU|nr:unnamed protein product [Psylliodes chrysocephala]
MKKILNETYENVSVLTILETELLEVSAFRNMKKLAQIEIEGINVTFLRTGIFRNVPELKSIKKSNISNIENDPFYDVPNLKSLLLSSNKLIWISADNLLTFPQKLTQLSLQHNLLTVVTKDTLNKLTNLINLDLSHNTILVIEKKSFDQTPHLWSLDLRYNQLKELDCDMFPTSGKNLFKWYPESQSMVFFLL